MQPDVAVHICSNCIPQGGRLPSQWTQAGVHVLLREIPCSGKIDGEYLMHTFEGGGFGICVVACPKGDCHLAQGNYRAEVRMHTVKKLLAEIGLEPERAELLHFSSSDTPAELEKCIRETVNRLRALGKSPMVNSAYKQQTDNKRGKLEGVNS
jgi:coenzyme F420-reducing hydrogenase delta subunit